MMNLIEQLEKDRHNELSADEKAQLQQLLATDELALQEAQAYGLLWDGLEALQEQHWRQQMTQWQQDWQAADETELMDAYWEDNLNPQARQAVVQRAAQDKDYQQALQQHGQLREALLSAADAAFAGRLRQWASEETPAQASSQARVLQMRSKLIRWASAAAVALVVSWTGLHWYARTHYTNQALVLNAYQSPSLGADMGSSPQNTQASLEATLQSAHQAMKQQQFAEASSLFQNILQTPPSPALDELTLKSLQQNAQWNLVLAQLALGTTPEPELQARLKAIAQQPGHAYAPQATQLLRQLNSPWRSLK